MYMLSWKGHANNCEWWVGSCGLLYKNNWLLALKDRIRFTICKDFSDMQCVEFKLLYRTTIIIHFVTTQLLHSFLLSLLTMALWVELKLLWMVWWHPLEVLLSRNSLILKIFKGYLSTSSYSSETALVSKLRFLTTLIKVCYLVKRLWIKAMNN